MTAEELKQIFGRAVPDRGKLQEIRLRAGKPVLVFMDGREYMVGREGLLEPDADLSPVLADPALIREILGIFSRHSLYAFEDEIRQGFLTIEGGHRVGIAGKAVTEGSGLRTIRDISSLNIRLAHEKPGCGDPVLPWLYENGRLQNTLILSPPGAGKTTLLRDVVRQVSNGNRYGPGLQTAVVVDEIGDREDLEALRYVMKCGCRILATVHGSSPEDLKKKPVLAEMVREGMFSRYVALSRRLGPGTVEAVCDGELRLLAGKGCQNEESGAGSPETEGKAEASGA